MRQKGDHPITAERIAVERILCGILAAFLVLLTIRQLFRLGWTWIGPFLVALPIAALLQPAVSFFSDKCKMPKGIAALIPVLFSILLLCICLFLIVSHLVRETEQIASNPSVILTGLTDIFQQISHKLETMASSLGLEGRTWAMEFTGEISQHLSSWLTASAGKLSSFAGQLVSHVTDFIVFLTFWMMGLFFLTRDYDLIRSRFEKWESSLLRGEARNLFQAGLTGALGYIRVQAFYAIVSLVAGIVFWSIQGNPYAAIISITAAVLEFIPVVGNGTVYLPWAAVEILLGNFSAALYPLGFFLCLLWFRRLTEPRMLSRKIGISPLLSLISTYVGLKAGGIGGMITGPVMMTVLVTFVRGSWLQILKTDINTIRSYLHHRWHPEISGETRGK